MCNIDEIIHMLDWNQPDEIQTKGRELARDVECFHVFIQPGYAKYNKNVWDNCASIIADKSDEELHPFLLQLFEWMPEQRKDKLELYQSLDENQKKAFLNSIKNAKANAVYGLLRMLEGFGSQNDRYSFEVALKINGVEADGELANTFWRVAMELDADNMMI